MSTITIPVNARAVPEDQRTQTKVRVAIKSSGKVHSKVVAVTGGNADAHFEFEGNAPVTVAVGPEATSAEDLFNKSTPTMTVAPEMAGGKPVYKPRPVVITEQIWRFWLFWCRKFTISGYVYGADGNPVPGAEVTAFNVDWFWWWSSTAQVGTAVTDPTGHFTITFEWCCGWLPWYWWLLRDWRLDPVLVGKINPVLALNPNLRVSSPQVRTVLGFSELNPQPLPPRSAVAAGGLRAAFNPQPDPPARSGGRRNMATPVELSPTTLPAMREKLLASLPAVPEFERFCLWPWCLWWPWLDCDPNIIFKVTQSCGGPSNVILQETVWQARQDIPTTLNVTLTASADACTIPPVQPPPEGDCFLFTDVCDVSAPDIGSTCDTSTPPLSGLAYPNASDRPFSGTVTLYGQFGTAAQVDYYEITYRPRQPCTSPPSTMPFKPVPPKALDLFNRSYFDATQTPPHQWFQPTFAPQSKLVSGGTTTVTVYESRQYYEKQHAPANWGDVLNGRSWTGDSVDEVAVIEPAGNFADGAYELQVVGYTANADGSVTKVGPLTGCGRVREGAVNEANDFAVYFGANASAPVAAINSLTFTVNGATQALPACQILNVPNGASLALAIDFTASDTEGFLDDYGFTLQHGTGAQIPIVITAGPPPVSQGTGYLTGSAGEQVGPTYADAISQHATRPNWFGGQYTLTVPDASSLFPETCAYELQLNVYKRNIVSCYEGDDDWAPAYYSFTVQYG